jgi:hypothetical protein
MFQFCLKNHTKCADLQINIGSWEPGEAQWYSTSLASTSPGFKPQYLKKKLKNKKVSPDTHFHPVFFDTNLTCMSPKV